MEVSTTRLTTRIVVNSIEESEVLCPSLHIVLDSDTHVVNTTIVLILGLPASITKKELDIFLEPFASDIYGICLIHEQKLCGDQEPTYIQHQNSALIFFTNEHATHAFRDLYNNMQLPSYSDTAPCIVICPIKLEVLLQESVKEAFPISLLPSSQALKLSSTSTTHSNSPFKPILHESTIYTMGIEQLLQYTVDSFPNEIPCTDFSKSTAPVQNTSTSTITNISKNTTTTTSLPTCTICMRRIRGVSTLSDSLTGTNELIIGRSYLCDNVELSFDEVNTIKLHNNTENTNICSITKEIIAKEGCESMDNRQNHRQSIVKCYPCYVYHTIVTSKRIGSPQRDNLQLQQLLAMRTTEESSNNGSSISTTNATNTSGLGSLGQCATCCISENIWMCLICGHTGCGRYTAQHAKAHYHQHSSHNLSLELASGRIWNYHTDNFCYYEDESVANPFPAAALLPPAGAVNATNITSSENMHTLSTGTGTSTTAEHTASDMLVSEPSNPSICHSSPILTKTFITPTFLYPNTPHTDTTAMYSSSNQPKTSRYFSTTHPNTTTHSTTSTIEDLYGLDSTTTGKITALMSNYESLLDAQLRDQQLYFEKLLARETVRALEQSFQYSHNNSNNNQNTHDKTQNTTIGNNKKSKSTTTSSSTKNMNNNITQKERNITLSNHSSGIEEKNENETETTNEEHENELDLYMNHTLHTTSFLTNSNKYQEAIKIIKNPEIQVNFQEVEELKLIISAAEADYKGVLHELKLMDDAIRILKKDNDVLIKAQKELRAEEVKVKNGTELLQRKSAELVADMKQQIQDLTFYTKTRQQVQESSLRDEIQHGTVITSQKPTPTTGKKGSFKKG